MTDVNSRARTTLVSSNALPPDSEQRSGLILLLITIAGGLLRFLYLGSKSFWTDEGASFVIAHQDWAGFWHTIFTHEANAGLYYLVLHFWLHLGNSEFVIRLSSVLAGLATLPAVYLLGERLFDRRTGLLAAALLAIHPSHLAYSQEARGYSFLVLFASLSTYFFVRGVERSSPHFWLGYSVCTVLAVYCHSFALLLIAAQLTSVVFLPGRAIPWRGLLVSLAAIALFAGPLLLLIARQNQGQWAWLPRFSLREFSHLMTFLTGNGVRFFLYLLFWIAAVAAWLRKSRLHCSAESWREALPIAWLVIPVVIVSIASLLRPILAPRFLIFCLPAGVLLAARGFFVTRYRKLALVALALLMAFFLASLRSYYRTPKEDWRGATQFVLSAAKPGEPVVVWDSPAFAYYRVRMGGGSKLDFKSPADWLQGSPEWSLKPRVWLVLYEHDSWRDPGKAILESMRKKCGNEQKRVFGRDIWVLRCEAFL
jgi:mannosyltransferase